jgi:sugar lactone lactonase YvrE
MMSLHASNWPLLGALLVTPFGGFAGDSIRTLAGAPEIAAHADGPRRLARFSDPAGLASDIAGNIFIADSANHCLRRLATDGTVSTLAGKPNQPGSDSTHFDSPTALAVAKDGTLFVADTGNHAIRRVSPSGTVTTLAGKPGEAGATNGVGVNARFNSPLGLALARDGTLIVADAGNHALRRVTTDGTVTTLAGELESWGMIDGPPAVARFNGPVGLAFDHTGNLFVADSANHAIRRLAPDGTVTTFAGKLGEDGCVDGAPATARFSKPAGLSFDAHGRLYVVDSFNHVLRRVTLGGTVSTVAGLAGVEGSADGTGGLGRFFNPYGLVVTAAGSLIVSDTYNQLIREVLVPFTLTVRPVPNSRPVIGWESVAGRFYRVLASDQMDAPWQTVRDRVGAASNWSETVDSDLAAGQHTRFYQVVELP